jgi:excisionase family DNA binding protein
MQVEGTRLYRVRDVAEHFDVSVATIYRAIESGQLAALKLGTGTGTFRVSGAAVLTYE